jgi:hypothetical protein
MLLNKGKQSAHEIAMMCVCVCVCVYTKLEATSAPYFIFLQSIKTTWQTYELQNGSDTSATCFRKLERHAVLVQITFLAGGIRKTLKAAATRIFPLATCLIHIEINCNVQTFLHVTTVANHLPFCPLKL